MSLIFATQLTAIATAVLAVFAIVTAWYARRAFLKQAQEVRAIEQQVQDAQELTRQQAELLKVQSGQLELQRHQADDQRQANARQAEVLELQADELRESLAERKRETEQRRRAQASRVLLWEDRAHERVQAERGLSAAITANASNTSDLPVYGLEFRWHKGTAPWGAPDYWPDLMPGGTKEFRRPLPADLPDSVDRSLFGATLRFRDAAGITWIRTPDGGLTEQQ
jgi:hypothetical protein